VKAQDFFSEEVAEDSVSLRRRVTLDAAKDQTGLRFRIGSGKSVSTGAENTFVIDEKLTIKVLSDHQAQVVDAADGKSLQIGLDLATGKQQSIELQYIWK